MSKMGKSTDTENGLEVTRSWEKWGKKEGEKLLICKGILWGRAGNGNVLKSDGVDGCTTL